MVKILWSMLLISLTLLTGCQQTNENQQNGQEMLPPTEISMEQLPAADGQAVIKYLTETNDYRQWPMFPGKNALYKGRHPHGAYLTTYVSRSVLSALENQTGRLPGGAIIVKENYSGDKILAAVTVMYRKIGYNPEAGDWYWLKYDPQKNILVEGKVESCIACHKSVLENDWVFTGPVK